MKRPKTARRHFSFVSQEAWIDRITAQVNYVERDRERDDREFAILSPTHERLAGSSIGTSMDWRVIEELSPLPDLEATFYLGAAILPEGRGTCWRTVDELWHDYHRYMREIERTGLYALERAGRESLREAYEEFEIRERERKQAAFMRDRDEAMRDRDEARRERIGKAFAAIRSAQLRWGWES
jgi:hypothetical protein